jgi:transposase
MAEKRNHERKGETKSLKDDAERTGIFTSGVVSTKEGRRIALFFTGRQHAGENLADVLRRRARGLPTPMQMCDALTRNLPKDLKVILGTCNAHNRRKYTEVVENFPAECRYVLETLAKVYKNDEIARDEKLSPEERLRFHQDKSGPLMADLDRWLVDQIEGRKVEENSGLGDAILYSLEHWGKLTLFLREPGAPLDNNTCETALKKAIVHRLCGSPHSRCYAEIRTMRRWAWWCALVG